jgi:hypothetical protein
VTVSKARDKLRAFVSGLVGFDRWVEVSSPSRDLQAIQPALMKDSNSLSSGPKEPFDKEVDKALTDSDGSTSESTESAEPNYDFDSDSDSNSEDDGLTSAILAAMHSKKR